MTVYVLVVLIAGHWMTISDAQGNVKTFQSAFRCEVAFELASMLQADSDRVEDHHCAEKPAP